jgi:hypothetical protein
MFALRVLPTFMLAKLPDKLDKLEEVMLSNLSNRSNQKKCNNLRVLFGQFGWETNWS